MKAEKVIEKLRNLIKEKQICIDGREEIEWSILFSKDIEALNQAIELLSRSIKKKPVKAEDGDPCCPKCFCNFYVEDLGQIFKDNYCGICGQALDWSGKDEL